MKYYVYEITNTINNKIYIGVHGSLNMESDAYMGSGNAIKSAIYKYGVENFTRKILHVYDNAVDAYNKEAELVTEEFVNLDNNYNLRTGGGRPGFSKSTIDKMIANNTGKNNPFYGKSHTQDHKDKISKLNKGKVLSEETKYKLRKSKEGFVFTEEHRRKISTANSGERHGMYGKNHSKSARTKISEYAKTRTGSKNSCAKSVTIDGALYGTIKEASECTGLSKYKIRKLIL